MVYTVSRLFFLILCKILFRLETRGAAEVPRTGPFLVVSNHASNLDPVVLGCAAPRRMDFLAKVELFAFKPLALWMRAVGVHPIHRGQVDRKALANSIRILKAGNLVAAFPEGTRTRDGGLQQAKPGVSMIAVQAAVPCLPAYVDGTYEALPRQRSFPRFRKVRVWFGAPFDLPVRTEGQTTREHYQACADEMMRRIALLRDQARAQHPGA